MKLPDELENLRFAKYQAPTNSEDKELPFSRLEPRVFEKLCCDYVHENCKSNNPGSKFQVLPIGRNGEKQYGADIFVTQNIGVEVDFSLYEIKRVEKFTPAKLEGTVERFFSNCTEWPQTPNRFTIIIASNASASLLGKLLTYEKAFRDRNIHFELVDASNLQRQLNCFPEIVYKYFHRAWVASLYSLSTLKSLENRNYSKFTDSASWDDYSETVEEEHDQEFIYQNEHIKLHCFLPKLGDTTSSCLVEIRSGRFSQVLITLNHRQLLETYFIGVGSPFDAGVRPYLSRIAAEHDVVCDLGNCRIFLTKEEAKCVASAFDSYWRVYRARVNHFFALRKSNWFPVYSGAGDGVALMEITRGLWSEMIGFSLENDAFRSKGVWSMFDSNEYYLKVYTGDYRSDMDVGYHAFIHAIEPCSLRSARSPSADVVLVWKSIPALSDIERMSAYCSRKRWDALITHDWLKNIFIPKLLDDYRKRTVKESGWRNSKVKASLNFSEVGRSFLESPDKDAFDFKDLHEVVKKIQFFFSVPRKIFISSGQLNRLFSILFIVFDKTKNKDFHYLNGNLSYLNALDFEDLKVKVLEFSRENEDSCDNHFKLDCIFRCFYVCTQEGALDISHTLAQQLLTELSVFQGMVENQKLIESQLERIGER